MEPENRRLFIEGAEAFGVHANERTLGAFEIVLQELMKWNRKINLTAIRSEKGIILKHFIDSLSVLPYVPESSSLLDVGSGAGFPGIPLKIIEPSLEVTLIDSARKKVDFQRHLIRTLRLSGIVAIHGRVQDREVVHQMQGRFDRVISRAFSDVSTFLEIARPFLKPGGTAVAMKGGLREEEISTCSEEEIAGYRLEKTVRFSLPGSALKRKILLFEKQ